MNDDVLIDVQGVSKKFCRQLKRSLVYGMYDMASELATGRRPCDRLRKDEFWALQDVSFQLRRGEALGLVGRNGSGKTTLLRTIAGLIRPDTGVIRRRGRIAPLLALGAGFNPVLTGLENIFVNMSILGMSKRDIEKRVDAVIDFAEIKDAIDAPLQTYSSGMSARLGFACAVHMEPDILLIDEVLAVGDIAFRAKCYRRLNEVKKSGTAFVLVSHNSHSVMSICQTGICLQLGRVVAQGPIESAMRTYEDSLIATGGLNNESARGHMSSQGLCISSVYFRDEDGRRSARPINGRPATLCLECQGERAFDRLFLAAKITECPNVEELCLNLSAYQDGQGFMASAGTFELRLGFPVCCLRPGSYAAKLSVAEGSGINVLAAVEAFRFQVDGGEALSGSTFYQPRKWEIVHTHRSPAESDEPQKLSAVPE